MSHTHTHTHARKHAHTNSHTHRHASLHAFDDDPRLRLLRPEWFEGRSLLDVGCNEGLVTLAVATRFGCTEAVGVDIDKRLVGKASR